MKSNFTSPKANKSPAHGGQRSSVKSFSVMGRNFVKTHNRVMSLGQMVALEMMNKYVKFHTISFNNVYKLRSIFNKRSQMDLGDHHQLNFLRIFFVYNSCLYAFETEDS